MKSIFRRLAERSDMYNVYIMKAIYDLAGSFISIFIPIYLLRNDLGLSGVFSYYLVYSISILFLFFLANFVVSILGLKKTVIINYPVLFLYFFLLYKMKSYGVPFYFIAIVSALQTSLYWFPLNIWLANTTKKESMGQDLSKFFVISSMVGLFAPIISAILLTQSGFRNLFMVSGVFYLISAIPLFYIPEFPYENKLNFSKFKSLFKEYRNYFVTDIFINIKEEAEEKIWPIFVYLSFRDFLSIGYVGTISMVGGILFTLLVGKYTDRFNKMNLFGIGAIILSSIWLTRFFVSSQTLVYILTIMATFFEPLVLIPIRSIVYINAKNEGAPTFILFREFANAIGRVSLYLFAILFIASIKYAFVFVSLACIGLFIMSRMNLERKIYTVNV